MSGLAAFTKEQQHVLKHSYGYDSSNPGFREHYCTESDDPKLLSLVALGLMTQGPAGLDAMLRANQGMFYLTKKAKDLLDVELAKDKKIMDPYAFEEFKKQLNAMAIRVQDISSDEKRGHWGTEAELALAELEDALGNCLDQIEFLRNRGRR